MRRPAWVLLAAAAACGQTTGGVGFQLHGPRAVVRFSGVTSVDPTKVRDYLAIASSRGDELRIVDPTDNPEQAVVSPGFVYPLSVPTAPRPLLLATSPLGALPGDGQADLLVAASAGTTSAQPTGAAPALELVATWQPRTVIAHSIDLTQIPAASAGEAKIGANDQILAIAGAPLPPGSPTPASPSALIVVAATGGKMVVIPFRRQTDGSILEDLNGVQVHSIVPTTAPAPVDCIDLAVPADNPDKYYCATADAVGTVGPSTPPTPFYGAVEIDAVTLTAVGLNARDKTVAVAVVDNLPERLVSNPDVFDDSSPPKRRVYAALDPSGCGIDRPIACGVATLDPSTGILPDPVGELLYRAPMAITGVPAVIRPMGPPAQGPLQQPYNTVSGATPPGMIIAPGSGQRVTPEVAAVGSSDGNVYVLDPGRWQSPNDISLLNGATRAQAKNGAFAVPAGITGPGLGLWVTPPGTTASASTNPADVANAVAVTPGYAADESWGIAYQGALPSLALRRGIVGRLLTGTLYAAVQTDSGKKDASNATIWTEGARLDDGRLGIEVGDLVELFPDDPTACPGGTAPTVTDFLAHNDPLYASPSGTPGSGLFPGGAVALGPVPPGCFDALPAGAVATVTLNVRVSGLLLTGVHLGYAGRPVLNQPFSLAYPKDVTEDALAAQCPPGQWPPIPETSLPVCDAACRTACERLVLARKARRRYYPSDPPCSAGNCYASWPGLVDPLKPGPVLAFTVGVVGGTTPVREATITFDTQSGVQPMVRRPTLGGNLPTDIATYDRSVISPSDGDRFYATFDDDTVLGFSPGQSSGAVSTLR